MIWLSLSPAPSLLLRLDVPIEGYEGARILNHHLYYVKPVYCTQRLHSSPISYKPDIIPLRFKLPNKFYLKTEPVRATGAFTQVSAASPSLSSPASLLMCWSITHQILMRALTQLWHLNQSVDCRVSAPSTWGSWDKWAHRLPGWKEHFCEPDLPSSGCRRRGQMKTYVQGGRAGKAFLQGWGGGGWPRVGCRLWGGILTLLFPLRSGS